jgi:vacuolar-type H+-ATPase subunit E/Vma4
MAAARDDWEDARSALSEREEWLGRALELGRAQLAAAAPPGERRNDLARLAREAIDRLPPGPTEIVVSAADEPLLGPEWRAALAAPADPGTIAIVTGPVEGGCLVRSIDGRAVFDNTWPARAERLQAVWRSALADVYERAISPLGHR